MPVEFLSDAQAAAYGRFPGAPSQAELERFFLLDDAAMAEVGRRRGQVNRLGFALQLTTVRYLGTFLPAPLDVPWVVVEYLAGQLGTADASVVKGYVERPKTAYEHSWEIMEWDGWRQLTDGVVAAELRGFLSARAWTRPERPSLLFDQAVTWLRSSRVLLPGVSVLARLVSEVRAGAAERAYSALVGKVDRGLAGRLDGLLEVGGGSRGSQLDRLCRAPTRVSGPELVRALDRAAELAAVGAGQVEVGDVPPSRLAVLARQGLTADAWALRRLPASRRVATLLAAVRALQVNAVDDALDLFAVLMAGKLLGPAERASVATRLRTLPQLRSASVTLADAARVLLTLLDPDGGEAAADPAAAWSRLQTACPGSGWRRRSLPWRSWCRPTAQKTRTASGGRSWSAATPRSARSSPHCPRWFRWPRSTPAARC